MAKCQTKNTLSNDDNYYKNILMSYNTRKNHI